MCRLPDKVRVGSESKKVNGFPDSNQRMGVGWEVGVKRWKDGGVFGGD